MQNNLKNILNKHGFSFKKAFGQNFLTDENLLELIVKNSGITKEDTVLEIGPGAGALTSVLAKSAKRVVAYEIDEKLKPVLNEVLQNENNVKINFQDVMKVEMKKIEDEIGENYFVVANLPYYITTPIIMRFLEQAKRVEKMVIMVQEEVADRLCATPGTADYGAITVAINLSGCAEKILRVPREKFTPAPNVDSAVVKISVDREKNKNIDYIAVRNLVKTAFNNRRKTFVNNLMSSYGFDRVTAEFLVKKVGLEKTIRGEVLSAEQFVFLANEIKKIKGNDNK